VGSRRNGPQLSTHHDDDDDDDDMHAIGCSCMFSEVLPIVCRRGI